MHCLKTHRQSSSGSKYRYCTYSTYLAINKCTQPQAHQKYHIAHQDALTLHIISHFATHFINILINGLWWRLTRRILSGVCSSSLVLECRSGSHISVRAFYGGPVNFPLRYQEEARTHHLHTHHTCSRLGTMRIFWGPCSVLFTSIFQKDELMMSKRMFHYRFLYGALPSKKFVASFVLLYIREVVNDKYPSA